MTAVRHRFWRVAACVFALGARAAEPEGESAARTLTFAPPVILRTEGGRTRVRLAGCEPDAVTGLPVLPVAGVTFAVPPGRTVEQVEVLHHAITEIPVDAPVEWGQPPPRTGETPLPEAPPDPAVYGGAQAYPDPAHTVWRVDPNGTGAAQLSVRICPVRYDPRRSVLLAAASVTVTARFRALLPAGNAVRSAAASELNEMPGPFTYVIVSTSNLIHNTPVPWNFAALRAARARAGFTTACVSAEWIDSRYPGAERSDRIREFVRDAHRNWGTRYLLIGGTFELIPVRKLRVTVNEIILTRVTDIPADALYYGCLDGPFDGNGNGLSGELQDGAGGGDVDLLAEVHVGRFPVADPEELSRMIRKTLRYEAASAEELAPCAFLAEKMDLGNLPYTHGFMDELRFGSASDGFTTIGFDTSAFAPALDTRHTLYDSDAGIWTAEHALAFLNRNFGVLNHIGHAVTKQCMKINLLNPAHRNALRACTNALPYFVYSQSCLAGAFDTPDCFAEQLVTVSNAAFASVMNAREGWVYNNTVGGYSHRFHRSFWDAALRGAGTRLGEIGECARRMNLHLLSPTSGNYWRWVFYELTLFGDPATPFAARINPAPPVFGHPGLINTYETQTAYRVACTLEPVGLYDPGSVRLAWRTDSEPETVRTQFLANVSGNRYETAIPAQPAGTAIRYALLAETLAGVTGRWPLEETERLFHVTDRLDLEIRGAPAEIGAPDPGYGTVHYASGLVAVASAPEHVAVTDETRHTCVGFTGGGSAPPAGDRPEAAFRIDASSHLTWIWRREHLFSVTSALPAFPHAAFWVPENEAAPVAPAPATLLADSVTHAFAEWWCDGQRLPPAPANSPRDPSPILADRPHRLTARYLPADQDEDGNGIPDWWETRYYGGPGGLPDSDDDLDGHTLVEEYADRTDPLRAASVPAPPVITHEPLADPQPHPAPFTVQARITDTHRVTSATLRWRRNADLWQTSPMTAGSNDLFFAEIRADCAPGDTFEYQIAAADPTGRAAESASYRFALSYPLLDTARFRDLAVIAQPTQAPLTVRMDLANRGNAELFWRVRPARIERIPSDRLPSWGRASLGQPWAVSTNRAFSPPYALHSRLLSDNQPRTPVRASITFPAVTLEPGATLSFRYWIFSEVHQNTTRAFDGGRVEISTDNGATFTPLRGPYTHTIYGWDASPWPEGTPCFAGKGTEGWQTATFDLAAQHPEANGFAGSNVVFRFHYGGDNNTDNEGWYLDDIAVSPIRRPAGFGLYGADSLTRTLAPGAHHRLLWSTDPSAMTVRDDALDILFDSNEPVHPDFGVRWQVTLREPPRLPGFGAAQTASGDGRVLLESGLAECDGEPVSLEVAWSPDNGTHWQSAALHGVTVSEGGMAGDVPDGRLALLPTSRAGQPVTNLFRAFWSSRDAVPPIGVNTQARFRVVADNGFFRATALTSRVTVDNLPPRFRPGVLGASPTSPQGGYAVTGNLLTLHWPAAEDEPADTFLRYRLASWCGTSLLEQTSHTLALSNALDRPHAFRVVALDPAGNASAPLDATLLVLNALSDVDGDGASTADEELAGTRADDPSDRFAARLREDAGALTLSWPGVVGRLYTIETTPSLDPAAWQPLTGHADIPGTGATHAVVLPRNAPTSFYRIRITLP
ncbi:MAG: C25 family cysteine peptidase [Kiritimatiellia bacterium]|nr:C25 family cysteine peptidase [Kiritimatiellia bacterium]